MNENMALKDNKKIISIGIIITAIVILSSIVIYSSVIKPQKYSNYLDLGNKYLLEGNYEEAILAFEKAIKIDEKSTEARVGAAKGYIGINDVDSAVEKLREAQNLDIENKKLIIEILNILKNVDTQVLHEMLEIYINKVGEKNISNEIEDISNELNDKPVELIVKPLPGTYINPITVEFDLNSIKFGHEYYYTTDGSIPNKSSNRYTKNIKINKNTQINIIGYNAKGESTEIQKLEYIIDDSSKTELDDLIKNANSLLNNTQEGTKVGNCKVGSKKNLKDTVQKIEKQLQEQILSYDNINQMKKQLNSAIDTFENNIIKNNNIEKKIIGKNWFNSGNIILVSENKIELIMGFHEGMQFDIIDKDISENRINYTVSLYGDISNIYISMNQDNIMNINFTKYSYMNDNYTIGTKNQIIKTAHESQEIGIVDDYNPNYNEQECIDNYDYYRFDEMGISLNDVKNYYKNN